LVVEAGIEGPVVFKAERAGFFVRKVQWIGRRDCTDRIFARDDRGTVWMEFKRPGAEPRSGQVREHEKMRKAGMEVHVVDSVAEGLRILGIGGHNGGPL
jgi:hypothetical protein